MEQEQDSASPLDITVRAQFEAWTLQKAPYACFDRGVFGMYIVFGMEDAFRAFAGGAEMEREACAKKLPDVLFDGFAVLQSMDDRMRARTSPENVSDVLDTIVKLMRSNV